MLEVIIILSFTALIFSGPLAGEAPYGLGLLLAGNALLCACISLLSSFPGTIAITQDAPSAILALAAISVAAALPAGTLPSAQFATLVVMISGATLVTGLFFLLLGYFHLGDLVRYLPYPVVGGFLAGTGWLLLTGAYGVMAGPTGLVNLFHPANLLRWLPGLLLGLALLFGTEHFHSPLALPGIFIAGVALFYLVAVLVGASPAQLSVDGWLMGPFPSGSLWHFPLNLQTFNQVNWTALGSNLAKLAPIPLVSVIALLLNATGLELAARKEFDINRELLVAGAANLLSSLVGGMAGYHTISLSNLNLRATGGKRLPGLVNALLLSLTIFASSSLLAYLPRVALGGLIAFLGLSLLNEWGIQARSRLSMIDFVILLLVLAVIALEGFLVGVLLGLVISVILFVVSYSRVSVVRHVLSGRDFHSRVNRGPFQAAMLEELGDGIYILDLQGFIFFGTANGLLELVRERTLQEGHSKVHSVLMAFERVSGLDSTGLLGFRKLLQLAQEKSFTLVLAGLSPQLRDQFSRGGLAEQPDILRYFPDLDHAMEWSENELLNTAQEARQAALQEKPPQPEGKPSEKDLYQALLSIYPDPESITRLLDAMQYKTLNPGEYLFHQGEVSDSVALVAYGQVTAKLEDPGREDMRLETMGSGRAVGELGFYKSSPRSAAVVADDESAVYLLDHQNLEQLEREDPEAAYAFHRIIIHLLVERVRHLMRAVEALQP